MGRTVRSRRALGLGAFALLALVAELLGRSLAHRMDVGRHVHTSYTNAEYYPVLLAFVKVAAALMLARVAWRITRARATASAGRRLVAALGQDAAPAPRMRLQLSPRLWLVSFALTSGFFLVQRDAEELSAGRWPLLAPWLHTSALPIFAVLAVVVAAVYGAVVAWLEEYESYARDTLARARSLALRGAPPVVAHALDHVEPPRRLFGLAFESRPPPLAAV